MTGKLIAGVIIIILIIAGVWYFMSSKGGVAVPPGTTGTASSTTDQVQGQDVSVGTGAVAAPGDSVSVLYIGYLGTISTSTIFDSSAAHGNQPLVFTLGAQGLISGFQIGVNGMKVGGERLLSIPPSLGYGAVAVHQDPNDPNSAVVIPANSTLIFDIKLVNVVPGTSTPATTGTSATQ